jgi:hypothetical protein
MLISFKLWIFNMKFNFILVACLLSSLFAYSNEQPCEKIRPNYPHRINFSLARLGYEHIQPNAIYVGAECCYVLGIFSDELGLAYADVEARMGYNFLPSPSNKLTPFIGGGYFHSFPSGEKQQIAYPSLGLRYEHVFGTVFNLGLNLEGMLGYSVNNKHPSWGNPIWGLDASLPFTWRFTRSRRWDFRLEPYFTGWFGQEKYALYGGFRNSFGYRF